LKLGKFIHTNKGFFLLSLAAAVIGIVASLFFGGCSRKKEPSRIIVSKRVKVNIKGAEVVPDETLSLKKEKSPVAGKPGGWEGGKNKSVPRRLHKAASRKNSAPKTKAAPKPVKRVKKRTALKTLNNPWVVNIASYSRISDAEKLKRKLSGAGYNAYISKFRHGGILYYRVRVGFYPTRDSARKAGQKIASRFRYIDSPWVAKPEMDEIIAHSK